MGKRTLKYGGKSGILPEVRPIFKKYPLKPKTSHEIAEESKIEQGYAEGIPLPKRKGFKFTRMPVEKPPMSVEERIKRNIEDTRPKDIDISKLSENEIWELKKADIRREHLKEAYLTEAKHLEELEKAKMIKQQKDSQNQKLKGVFEVSSATKLTLPTIDAYLEGPIMRQRTEEEEIIVQNQRLLNRKVNELKNDEAKAEKLLDLYHAAASFITTEEELDHAIKDAFEINISKFESNQMIVENNLSGYSHTFSTVGANESLIMDEALGELNGQPGLESIRDTLNGESEKLKLMAQTKVNQSSK